MGLSLCDGIGRPLWMSKDRFMERCCQKTLQGCSFVFHGYFTARWNPAQRSVVLWVSLRSCSIKFHFVFHFEGSCGVSCRSVWHSFVHDNSKTFLFLERTTKTQPDNWLLWSASRLQRKVSRTQTWNTNNWPIAPGRPGVNRGQVSPAETWTVSIIL